MSSDMVPDPNRQPSD